MRHGQLAGESQVYRKLRAELLEAEIALRDQRKRVAQLRRQLPLDTQIEDYVLHEGPEDLAADGEARQVRLSGLFADGDKPLVLYHYMLGGAQKKPCPMCTMWTDGFDALVPHLRQRVNFAIVAQAEVAELRAWARQRGWRNLRLVSSKGCTLKADLQFEDAQARQYPGISVIVRQADGSLRHFYSASDIMKENEYRGLELFSPVWHLLDLTPQGRGGWMPRLRYEPPGR